MILFPLSHVRRALDFLGACLVSQSIKVTDYDYLGFVKWEGLIKRLASDQPSLESYGSQLVSIPWLNTSYCMDYKWCKINSFTHCLQKGKISLLEITKGSNRVLVDGMLSYCQIMQETSLVNS